MDKIRMYKIPAAVGYGLLKTDDPKTVEYPFSSATDDKYKEINTWIYDALKIIKITNADLYQSLKKAEKPIAISIKLKTNNANNENYYLKAINDYNKAKWEKGVENPENDVNRFVPKEKDDDFCTYLGECHSVLTYNTPDFSMIQRVKRETQEEEYLNEKNKIKKRFTTKFVLYIYKYRYMLIEDFLKEKNITMDEYNANDGIRDEKKIATIEKKYEDALNDYKGILVFKSADIRLDPIFLENKLLFTRTLVHELAHANYSLINPIIDHIWSLYEHDEHKPSNGYGHGEGNPSGEATKTEVKLFDENVKNLANYENIKHTYNPYYMVYSK